MGKMDITKEDKKQLASLEKRISYKFKDKEKLKRALTHKSYAYELKMSYDDHNERYEYLGDAVIELCVSRLLFDWFPTKPEGELSRLRAAIVNETQLAEISKGIALGDYLYLGKGESGTGGRDKPSLLSDALEALCGAVYLDRGFDQSAKFVFALFKDVLAKAGDEDFMCDYKTKLQEEVQARFKVMPKYVLLQASGPDHCKKFEVELYIADKKCGRGEGKTKKAAEQEAARAALEELRKKS